MGNMLSEYCNDERKKNGSTLPSEFDGFEEVDDDDLVEIALFHEKKKKEEEKQEVRVLVEKPGMQQQLVICDVLRSYDERDILKKVHSLFQDREYYYKMYRVNYIEFDYIVQYYKSDIGKDFDKCTEQGLRRNYLIPEIQDDGGSDDEVVEVTPKEVNNTCDSDVVEEILTDDEVAIEKIVHKENLVDESEEEVDRVVEVKCERMEVEEWTIEEDGEQMEEDVLPIEGRPKQVKEEKKIENGHTTYKFGDQIEEDEEIEESRMAYDKYKSKIEEDKEIDDMQMGYEGDKEIEEMRDSFDVYVTQVETKREKLELDFSPVKKRVTQNNGGEIEDLDLARIVSGEMKMEIDMDIDKYFVNIESEKETEESDREIKENEKEMEEDDNGMKGDDEKIEIETVSLDDESESPSLSSGNKTILFIYPMSRGGITVTRADYECLSECQYLNDIIIDFYLKYLMQEVLSDRDRERTHLFSSHFYSRLTKLSDEEDSTGLSLDERRYAGVQRWTKDVDIFEKDFIIVPINQHSHWFLAIICFPKLVDFVGSDDCDCECVGTELQKPCILMLDSLGGSYKSRVAGILRGYLRQEYKAKMYEDKEFTTSNLKTEYPKIPYQQNATDCGLYVLQYVESFFKDPLKDFTRPLKNLSDWFPPELIERKREKIAKLIAKLAVKYNKGKTVLLPMLKFQKPKLLESLEKASTSLLSKKTNASANTRTSGWLKKISPKHTGVKKRLQRICDSDTEDSDSSTVPLTRRSKLRVSSHNPRPLRRSAAVPRSKVPNYYSMDESDDSPRLVKTSSGIPPSRFYPKASQSFRAKSNWGDFSDLTKSEKTTEKKDVPDAYKATDPFYNLSMHALLKAPSLPTNLSFTKYKIQKKNGEHGNL